MGQLSGGVRKIIFFLLSLLFKNLLKSNFLIIFLFMLVDISLLSSLLVSSFFSIAKKSKSLLQQASGHSYKSKVYQPEHRRVQHRFCVLYTP